MSGVYHPVQRLLHWAVAIAIAIAIPLGIGIENLSEEEVRAITGGGLGKGDLYWWHKSFGFLVLFLMILRLGARLRWKEPPYDPPLAAHERIGAMAVHKLLYVALIVLPILGWLGTSYFGPGVANFFGLTMPDLVEKDRDMAMVALGAHGAVAMGVIGLIALHLGGAAWHGFIKRDGVIDRMIGGPKG